MGNIPREFYITLHKARNLERKGMLGKADPYVKITFEDQIYQSKTVKNNHNPEWEFLSKFTCQDPHSNTVTFEVFDEDIGKDDSLDLRLFKSMIYLKTLTFGYLSKTVNQEI